MDYYLLLQFFFFSDRRIKKIASEDEIEEASKVRPKKTFVLFTNYDKAYDMCLGSVDSGDRLKLKSEDREKGIINAKLGINWHTLGNKIVYKLSKLTDVTTEVELMSFPLIPTVLVTSGEGWKAIKAIAEHLDEENQMLHRKYLEENKTIPADVHFDSTLNKEEVLVK